MICLKFKIICFVLSGAIGSSAFAQQWSGFKSGEIFEVRISHLDLEASPRWELDRDGEPRITSQKAYKIANDKLFSAYPELKRLTFRNEIVLCSLWNGVNYPKHHKDGNGREWSNKSMDRSVARWLYCVNYSSIPVDGMTGIDCKFGVAVLMNGTVVLPVVHRDPTDEELVRLYRPQ